MRRARVESDTRRTVIFVCERCFFRRPNIWVQLLADVLINHPVVVSIE